MPGIGESVGRSLDSRRGLNLGVNHLDTEPIILGRADTRINVVLLHWAGHVGISLQFRPGGDVTLIVIGDPRTLDIYLTVKVEVLNGQPNLILVP